MRRVLTAAVAASMFVGASAVRAAEEAPPLPAEATEPATTVRHVLVLPTVFTGDLPEATRAEFEAAFADGLARAGVTPRATSSRLQQLGCTTAECVRASTAMVDAIAAVRLQIVASGRDYDVVIELFDGERGTLVAKTGERCELCGVAETRDVIASHAAALRRRMDAVSVAPPRLQIFTRPARAALSIDGVAVGNAPLARVVTPGRHLVRAELPRHRPAERTVTAISGVDEIVELQLSPLDRGHRAAMRPAGWSLLAIGSAALVAGVVLVAIDGNENRAVCRGDDVDVLGNCRYLHRTKVPGIATLVSAGVLLGGGIGLVAASSAERMREAGSTHVTRRGAVRLAIRWRLQARPGSGPVPSSQ